MDTYCERAWRVGPKQKPSAGPMRPQLAEDQELHLLCLKADAAYDDFDATPGTQGTAYKPLRPPEPKALKHWYAFLAGVGGSAACMCQWSGV